MAKVSQSSAFSSHQLIFNVTTTALLTIIAVGVSLTIHANYIRVPFILLGLIAVFITFLSPSKGMRALVVISATVYFSKRLEYFIYRNDSSEFNNPVSILPELLIFCLFISTYLRVFLHSQKFSIPRSALSLSVIGFFILSVIGIVNPNSNLVVGLYGFRVSSFYVLLFFVGQQVFERDKSLYDFLRFVISISLLIAIYGLWQQFVEVPAWDQEWFLNFFGIQQYSWIAGANFSWEELRKYSVLKSPMSAAFFYGISLLTTVVLLSVRFTLSRVVVFIILALALAVTYVRGSWIACMISIPLTSLLLILRYRFRNPRSIQLVALVLSVTGGSLFYLALRIVTLEITGLSAGILRRVQSLTNPFQASEFLFRADIWRETIIITLMNPLGLGIGSTGQVAQRFATGPGVVDSIYFKLLVELGWPGLILFIAIVYFASKAAWNVYLKSEHVFYRGFAAGMLGLILFVVVNGIVGAVLEYQIGMIFFWTWLGIIDSIYQERTLPTYRFVPQEH